MLHESIDEEEASQHTMASTTRVREKQTAVAPIHHNTSKTRTDVRQNALSQKQRTRVRTGAKHTRSRFKKQQSTSNVCLSPNANYCVRYVVAAAAAANPPPHTNTNTTHKTPYLLNMYCRKSQNVERAGLPPRLPCPRFRSTSAEKKLQSSRPDPNINKNKYW